MGELLDEHRAPAAGADDDDSKAAEKRLTAVAEEASLTVEATVCFGSVLGRRGQRSESGTDHTKSCERPSVGTTKPDVAGG